MEFGAFITIWLERAVYLILPFFCGITLLLILQKMAEPLGMVDKPTERKAHIGNIPLVGGPAMFIALATAASVLVPQFQVLIFLILTMSILAVGVIDDILDIPAIYRLVLQALIALGMVLFADVKIDQVGNLLGSGVVEFSGITSVIFTVLCVIGVINAINMIDGADGLAGSILIISFSAMATLAWHGNDWVSAKLLVIFVGSVCAFLAFNARIVVKKALLFMGDSGSMLLGFILAWFLIHLSQGESASISPVVAGWIFGIPLMDTIVVMVRRVLSGKSPFAADRQHFHHRLLDNGFSVNQTVFVTAATHSAFVLVGLVSNQFKSLEPVLFWLFVVTVLIHFFFTEKLLDRFSPNPKAST